jgi:L-aspartate oxidase
MKTQVTQLGQAADILVVGSGLAGLVTALSLAPHRVKLITKTAGLAGGSSLEAKGGIAAAVGPGDTPAQHAEDTLAAGAGLSDAARALGLAEEGVEALNELVDAGVPFDRALDGTLALAREAAHRRARVVHAGGDATGRVVVTALIERVLATPSIEVCDNTCALDLVIKRHRVCGLLTVDPENGLVMHRASRVVLATGGIGRTWWQTTNPKESTGDGLAIAARAGARLSDLEFMQFHPTALDASDDGSTLPLLTEALRGAGAKLIDADGRRFMKDVHDDAELAPRDVVARAIHERVVSGVPVFIDLRPIIEAGKTDEFPRALAVASEAGLDAQREPLPVVPAAHYHMGGVQVDDAGRSSVPGLWACGEVATTGVHGANRLASNSLLEAVVYARRVARDVAGASAAIASANLANIGVAHPDVAGVKKIVEAARRTMSRHVGIARTAAGLEKALRKLDALESRLESMADVAGGFVEIAAAAEARNLLLVSRLVTLAALQRQESRGAHYRGDHPTVQLGWRCRQAVSAKNLAWEFERQML